MVQTTAIAQAFENQSIWNPLKTRSIEIQSQISNVSAFQMVQFQIPTVFYFTIVSEPFEFIKIDPPWTVTIWTLKVRFSDVSDIRCPVFGWLLYLIPKPSNSFSIRRLCCRGLSTSRTMKMREQVRATAIT